MACGLGDSALWAEAQAMPAVLAATLDAGEGLTEVAALLGRPPVRRIVVTGNGAAYYAALALWVAALCRPPARVDLVAVPAGVLASDFGWRPGDLPLVVSSSGRLRDVVELLDGRLPRPFAAVTADPDSPIGRSAAARAVVITRSQRALTHTQAYVGNVVALLAVWARLTGDRPLEMAVAAAPEACQRALAGAAEWAANVAVGTGVPAAVVAFGDGPGWPAAMEAALLCKEVARVPAEGMELREGATSGMYALGRGQLALSIPARPSEHTAEAERTCRATGAAAVRVPGAELGDPRLAPVTTFPAALALAAELGLAGGRDIDRPDWAAAYYATARSASRPLPADRQGSPHAN